MRPWYHVPCSMQRRSIKTYCSSCYSGGLRPRKYAANGHGIIASRLFIFLQHRLSSTTARTFSSPCYLCAYGSVCGLDFRVAHALHVSTITDDAYEPRRRLFVCLLSRLAALLHMRPLSRRCHVEDAHTNFVGRLHLGDFSWIRKPRRPQVEVEAPVSFPIPCCS